MFQHSGPVTATQYSYSLAQNHHKGSGTSAHMPHTWTAALISGPQMNPLPLQGSEQPAGNKEQLLKNGITDVINVAATVCCLWRCSVLPRIGPCMTKVGGGGSEAPQKVCVPEIPIIDLQFRAPLISFICS